MFLIDVLKVLKPYKLASSEFKELPTVIKIGDVSIGGKEIALMAGPCSVEDEEQIYEARFCVEERLSPELLLTAFKD